VLYKEACQSLIPTDCELSSVIPFLTTKNILTSEMHGQLIEVSGESVMDEDIVRKQFSMLNGGMHNEARYGRPSDVTEDLKCKVDSHVPGNRRFTAELHDVFP
jgi:hypothetical protein